MKGQWIIIGTLVLALVLAAGCQSTTNGKALPETRVSGGEISEPLTQGGDAMIAPSGEAENVLRFVVTVSGEAFTPKPPEAMQPAGAYGKTAPATTPATAATETGDVEAICFVIRANGEPFAP